MAVAPNSPAARDIAHVLHPTTELKGHRERGPLVVERGEGIYVYDDTGRRYMETTAGAWCLSLGYGDNELAEVAAEQMRKLGYASGFFGRSAVPVIDLAEKLTQVVPFKNLTKVFFLASGSEANDTQVKLLWYYNNAVGRPRKKKIISRVKAYHGSTWLAASLTGLPQFHNDWDAPAPHILHTDCPHHYRFAQPGESEEAFATRLADSLEALIQREGPDTVAGFIAEPVMGAGGVFIPPKTYYEKVQAVLKRYDVLFIADEVITGFYRTGRMFGCETMGIKPDTMTMAKALSASYQPIAAVMIPEYMYDVLVEQSAKHGLFGHGYTYGGHPVAAAVALRTLEIYERRNILGHVQKVSRRFLERLKGLADHPLVGEATGIGLMGAVELVADKKTKRPFPAAKKVGAYCSGRAFEHGLVGRNIGDRMAFSPPLVITAAEIDDMFDRFAKALDETATWVERERLRAA